MTEEETKWVITLIEGRAKRAYRLAAAARDHYMQVQYTSAGRRADKEIAQVTELQEEAELLIDTEVFTTEEFYVLLPSGERIVILSRALPGRRD